MIKKITLFALITLLPLNGYADAHADYSNGIIAFKSQNYSQAIALFLKAKKSGINSENISYNLGSSYYKAERYNESISYFSKLINSSKWAAMAHYNLGLIAEKTNNNPQAEKHFQLAYDNATSAKIKHLAKLKLTQQTQVVAASLWHGIASVAAGYDSNAMLFSNNDTGSNPHSSDYYLEAWATAGNYLRGDYNNGLHTNISAFNRSYVDYHGYNFTGIEADISREKQHAIWHSSRTLTAAAYFSEGNISSKQVALAFDAERPYRNFNIGLGNETQYIVGQSAYNYISGWSNQTTASISHYSDQYNIKAGYQLTLNHRKDLRIDNNFYSYSPTQHQLYLALHYRINTHLWLQIESQYRNSDYNNSNQTVNNDETIIRKKRQDQKTSHSVRANYQHPNQWLSFIEYSNNNNQSNIDYYAYHRWQLSLGIEKTF